MASVVGEASSSSPPSTSIPPPPPRSCTYHVFLSFSGKDTRNGLTGHLLAALERKGIKTFIDDRDLETGEDMKVELLKAIEESMFAIIVFSPNYASSSWCLDELQHIVECRTKLGLSIVPVFYGVEPWHVRHQTESFGEEFKKQEDRFGQNSEKVTGWRNALAKLANLSGEHFKDKHEATLVESIANHIHKKLIPKLPSSTKNLVGIASRMEEVMMQIDIGLNEVRFVGIWGMGGIGKTTIARAIFEAIQGEFEVSCFLDNVREARERNRIVDKQKELVDQANISANTFYNEHEGKIIIQTSLCNKKVLLVLDDVSDEVELKNLAGEQDWFGQGSRIIITTRDIQLLKIYEAHGTCEVRGLIDSESSNLFCLKAFKQKKLDEKYLDLATEVVKYSGGLPLALQVLGSHLCGRSIDVWHDAIEKIKSTPFAKIHDRLKISYDSLDDMDKNIFLDIACFFKGKETDYVTKLLEICGYNARIGIDVLIERSLVKINEESNVFEMHDLLQEMGRNIVIKESPNPGERSRLWSLKDIDLVFRNNKGSEAIQGVVRVKGWSETKRWSAEAFSNMTQLKLFIMDSKVVVPGLSLPTSLKVLHWRGYPLETLPLSDQQYELVEIRLEYSRIKNLRHGEKSLGKLTHLDLSGSPLLKQTPDLSEIRSLQKLVLKFCGSLTEVHPSVVRHKSLTLLDLSGCDKLEALPGKLEMSSLIELILDGCWNFKNLPEFGECMKNLSRLSLKGTSIRKLPISLGCLVGLEDLNLDSCRKLKCLPNITDGIVQSLRTLNLSDLNLTEESFLPDFGHFPSLTDLDLSGNDSVSIPIGFHELPKHKCLKLSNCNELQCLPELPSSIRELEALNCDSLEISEFDILSKVYGAFVSPSQDPNQVLLEMVISGSKIPSWFDHRQDGNSISIPPRNERLGIAFCFQITASQGLCRDSDLVFSLGFCNDYNGFITTRGISIWDGENYLYIICLAKDYFSDGFPQGTCFELSFYGFTTASISMISAARWVSKEDIEDLKKSEIENRKKKEEEEKMFDLNHELPKLKCLKLSNCNELQYLPELPSSIRELEALNCDSLEISEFDILSKVYGVFVSPSQDPSQVLLEMVISGTKIPSWFDHRQDGYSISIPPRNERLGIAFCFQITAFQGIFRESDLDFFLGFCNDYNGFITKREISVQDGENYLYIICLAKDYFSDGFPQGTCFELSFSGYTTGSISMISAARWVSKEDIEDLKKSEIENPKTKKKRNV